MGFVLQNVLKWQGFAVTAIVIYGQLCAMQLLVEVFVDSPHFVTSRAVSSEIYVGNRPITDLASFVCET